MSEEFETVEVDFGVTEEMVEDLNQTINDLEPHQKEAFAKLTLMESIPTLRHKEDR